MSKNHQSSWQFRDAAGRQHMASQLQHGAVSRQRMVRGTTNDLRVTSGRYRGINLQSPATSITHPMGAREKLALFNMVSIDGAKVLDAYAGSGALGIEALSRGANEVIFVENNHQVAAVLRDNLRKINQDCPVFVEKVTTFTERAEYADYFNVIIADPPYDQPDLFSQDLMQLAKILRPDGILVLSSPAELGTLEITGFRLSSTHTYARARLTVYYKTE